MLTFYFLLIPHSYSIIIQQSILTNSKMIFYIISFILLCIFTIFIVCYYSHPETPKYVQLIVFISLYFTFLPFIILPDDIYETQEQSQLSQKLKTAWTVIYGVNFFLCWFILPIVQQFQDSGDFTFKGRMLDSLKINAVIFGALGIGGLVVMLILIFSGKFTASQLPELIPTLVNIFGLTLVSILLGFGLVSFPKQCYRNAVCKRRVKRCHLQAQKLNYQQQEIRQLVFEIKKILERRQDRAGEFTDGHEATILFQINEKFNFDNYRSLADRDQKLEKTKNCDLRTMLKKKIVQFDACENQLNELVDELKTVTEDFSKNNYSYKGKVYFAFFILTTLISVLIFWAQICTFVSVFTTVNAFGYINKAPAVVAYFLNLALIIYISYIVTHTVFRIKVFHKFALHKSNSSSASLCFTCINLSRIAFPLCYNYSQITNMPQSSFLKFFGVISISEEFSFIFPIIMIVFALLNVFNVYSTILGYLGYQSYAFDDEEQEEKLDEGKTILLEKYKKRNIQLNRMEMIEFL